MRLRSLSVWLLACLAVPFAWCVELLRYNRPGVVAPLTKRSGRGVMMSTPVDWDGDGKLDLLADQRVYLHLGGNVFRKGPLLDYLKWASNTTVADLDGDGRWDIVEGAWDRSEIRWLRNTGTPRQPAFAAPEILVAPPAFEVARPPGRKPLLYAVPAVADFNGDGLPDLLVGGRDIWTDYFPYLPSRSIVTGRSYFGGIHGELYLLLNRGSRTRPQYPSAEPLRMDGQPVTVFGLCAPVAADWDGDGDLDLLVTQEAMPALLFENTGDRLQARWARPRPLFLRYAGIYSRIQVVDWDRDGLPDLLASSEDGEYLFRNEGSRQTPYFSGAREAFQELDPEVWVPGFATPHAADYDGDGNLDLIIGSDDGDFRLFRNLGSRQLAEGRLLGYSDGRPIQIRLDFGFQPQGPVERFWAYTSPVLADWDGDGDLDLLSGQISTEGYLFLENRGSRSRPCWSEQRLIEAAGRIIRTAGHARMRPAPVDWNGDGLMDLVAVNDRHEYTLHLRQRTREGGLRLQAGQTLRFASGKPVSFTAPDDVVGRRDAVNVVDWDGDGDWDVLTGLNSSTGGFVYLENRGNNAAPSFALGKEMTTREGRPLRQEARRLLEGFSHTPNIDVVDWNGDGTPDLLVGQDMGFVVFFDGIEVRPAPAKRGKR